MVPQVSLKFGISPFSKTFDQFSPSSLKLREFSPFNQLLLSLSDVSSAFHDSMLDYFYFMNNILLTLIHGGFLFSLVRIFFLRTRRFYFIFVVNVYVYKLIWYETFISSCECTKF